jgi:hypothetical protein
MTIFALALIAAIGAVSAVFYARSRQWINAALVLCAAAALAALVAKPSLPSSEKKTLTINATSAVPDLSDVAAIRLDGDGLRAAQWRDLPARPLQWTPPTTETLRLDFPRQLPLGRIFSLTMHRQQTGAARLQLLAENEQVIAEASGTTADLSVQWLPPVAEALVLKARLLDAAGKTIAEGPVPLLVRNAPPLQVLGRFSAPSFDTQALNTLLANSHAILDWQLTLGKTLSRAETARTALAAPDLVVIDAAYFERLHAAARAALLAQVAQGVSLLVLGGSASDPAPWSATMGLQLGAQAEKTVDGQIALATAPFNPASATSTWQAQGKLLWARQWQKGRITWLGGSDWHRYAISEPQLLGLWWQNVLDAAGVRRLDALVWQDPEEMPLPHQRLEVCANGVSGELKAAGLEQKLNWERRSDKADASCAALWPAQSGWLQLHTRAGSSSVYVFAETDWPAWQRAQRRDATMRYQARSPGTTAAGSTPLPAWPSAAMFALLMLALWWRERR